MRIRMRAAALLVMGLMASGCIEENDNFGAEHTASAVGDHEQSAQNGPAAATTTINATMSEWSITLSPQSASAGTISFEVQNNGTEAHVFEIEGGGNQWKTEPIQPGGRATLSVALASGAYNIYCPLDSGGEAHADRGMKTTIRVD